jgi:hypothetical protein
MASEIIYLIQYFRNKYEDDYDKYRKRFEELLFEIYERFVYYMAEKKLTMEEAADIASEINELNRLSFPRTVSD